MKRTMLVIGGSLDGRWVEWDDHEPMMRAPLRPQPRPFVVDLVAGVVPQPEPGALIETYHVKTIILGDGLVWFLTVAKSRGLGLTMDIGEILQALVYGYRKPLPCQKCHQVPTACAYCGYEARGSEDTPE